MGKKNRGNKAGDDDEFAALDQADKARTFQSYGEQIAKEAKADAMQ